MRSLSLRDQRGLNTVDQGNVSVMDIALGGGISNPGAWLFDMRARGLEIPCTMITVLNRDGKKCRAGRFSLTDADRKKIHAWLAE